jgi:hypothetical protein
MIDLNLPYRGNRNYIHGTDLFSGISNVASALALDPHAYVKSIAFHQKAVTMCTAQLHRPSDLEFVRGRFSLSADTHQSEVLGWIIENGTLPTNREAYDEDAVVAGAYFDRSRKALSSELRSGYTTIQTVVAMMKSLCGELRTPQGGRWMFGSLQLSDELPSICGSIEIVLTRLISDRYAVATVVIDGDSIGTLRFIWEQ